MTAGDTPPARMPGQSARDPGEPRRESEGTAAAPPSLELALAHVLQLGTYASVGLVALGSILQLATGGSPIAGGPAFDIAAIPADIAALRPGGFLWLGILGVLSTPALRVGRALLGFARRQERRMVGVSASVLAVIAVGIVVGVMAR